MSKVKPHWLCSFTTAGFRPFLIRLLVLAAGVTVLAALTTPGRAQVKAVLLVSDVLYSSPHTPLRLLTRPAVVETVAIPTAEGLVEARYYQAAGPEPHGAMILVLGYPSNINDPQLIRLADGLARLGIAVLTPRLPRLRVGELVAQDVDALVAAFEWLSVQPDIEPDYVGFGGFCVGSSLALVAAEDARIHEQVAVVNVFGGYYDLVSFLRATAAHSALYNGREYPWQPAAPTVALFAQNVLLQVDDPRERTLLMERLQNNPGGSEWSATLTSVGKVAYSLLTTTEVAEVDRLLTQIPADKMAQLATVSPSTRLNLLKAKVFIMHDVSDPYVPVTESYRLRDAIDDPSQKVYAQFELFSHVRPARLSGYPTLVLEGIKLSVYLGRLLVHLLPE